MDSKIILSKESSEADLKNYFMGVLELSKSKDDFPVNLDDVWMLVYNERGKATKSLRKNFIENVDFISVAQSGKQDWGGSNRVDYYLSTSCLEFFIARKKREVFEIYRQVFHKVFYTEISLPDFSNPAEAARAWAAEYEQKQQLTLENKRQAQELEVKDAQITELNTAVSEMQPKVSYVDTILQCKDTVQTTIIAQDYGKSAKAFNILLRNFGIQRKVGTAWVLYAKHISNGYVQSKTFTYKHKDGTDGARTYSEWTQRGRLFLYDTLKKHGILPMIEQ